MEVSYWSAINNSDALGFMGLSGPFETREEAIHSQAEILLKDNNQLSCEYKVLVIKAELLTILYEEMKHDL